MEIFMFDTRERRDDDRTSTEVCFKTMTKYWDLNFFTVYSLHSCESLCLARTVKLTDNIYFPQTE